jgi:hypothetical protein
MRFEVLIQFIVPLTFLAIWALTSILNRDAQPLPPRPTRPPGPGGMRPVVRTPAQPDMVKPGGLPLRPAPSPLAGERPADWSGGLGAPSAPLSPPRARPRLGNLDDAIVYIENGPVTRTPSRSLSGSAASGGTASRPARSTSVRRGSRGRSGAGSAAVGRAEPETPRALTDQITQALAQRRSKPLEISPLSAPLSSLTRPLSGVSTPPQAAPAPIPAMTSLPFLGGAAVQTLLASPSRLREVVILTEILRPPLALRKGRT